MKRRGQARGAFWLVLGLSAGAGGLVSCGDDAERADPPGGTQAMSGRGGSAAGAATGGAPSDAGSPGSAGLGPDGATRIAEQVHAAPGGAQQLVALYDTELESPCSFEHTGEEGGEPVFHCLPAATAQVVYTDENCETPVAVAAIGCGSATKAGDLATASVFQPGCGALTSYFTVGEPTTASELYSNASGDCLAADHYLDDDLFEVAPLGDFSAYVRGTLTSAEVDASTGLQAVMISGEDGSASFHEYRVASGACTTVGLDRASQLCLPYPYASTDPNGLYADDGCGQVLATASASACGDRPAPTLVLHQELVDGCYRPAQAFEVGELGTPSAVYTGNACSEGSPSDGVDYYTLGSEVALESLPLLEEVAEGSGRLQALRWSAGDGSWRGWGDSFYDTELDARCTVHLTEDGALRCLVEGPYTTGDSYFSDDGCSEPLWWLYSGGCNPVFQDGDLDYERDYSSCPPVTVAAFELATHDGPVYEGTPGSCSVVEPSSVSDRTFVTRADEVPLTAFAEVELAVR